MVPDATGRRGEEGRHVGGEGIVFDGCHAANTTSTTATCRAEVMDGNSVGTGDGHQVGVVRIPRRPPLGHDAPTPTVISRWFNLPHLGGAGLQIPPGNGPQRGIDGEEILGRVDPAECASAVAKLIVGIERSEQRARNSAAEDVVGIHKQRSFRN